MLRGIAYKIQTYVFTSQDTPLDNINIALLIQLIISLYNILSICIILQYMIIIFTHRLTKKHFMHSLTKRIYSYIFFASVAISIIATAKEQLLTENPIIIDADKYEYVGQEENSKIIAIGDVVATQDDQVVKANYLEYDLKNEIILAKDKVKILEKKGYIIDADQIIINNKLKLGSMEHFTIFTPDKSTLRGELANKDHGIIKSDQAYYTACQVCTGKSPIWDIKAKTYTLDQDENSMTYNHAVLRYYGVPAIYTPYFSHYTNKAERKSGFLKPQIAGSGYTGKAVKIPYYFNLAPNYDATVNLVTTEKRGFLAEGEYRHLFSNGSMINNGSITPTDPYINHPFSDAQHSEKDPDIRYHLDSKSDFSLANNNYVGWKAKVTSDKSYLRDYKYGTEDFLTSRVYNSAYQKNGFYEVQALSFQNLRPETSTDENNIHQTPMVLPLFESNHKLYQFNDGSNYSFESNFLKIHRYAGADTNRLSIKNKWDKDSITNNGHRLNFFGSVRNDFYHYDEANINNKDFTGNVSRTIPEAGIGWSYPLGRNIGNTKMVIEPLAKAVYTPITSYNKDVYNEDSPSNELNDANLFSESRYSGLDLVENTSRISYGLKTSAYFKDQVNGSALLGQMYRQNPYDYINKTTEDRFSDYIGRLKFDLANRLIGSYRFTFDKDTLVNKTNEVTVRVNQDKAFIQSDLLYYRDDKIIDNVKNRREITMETGINDYHGVTFSVNAKRNITSSKDNPGMDPAGFTSAGAKIKYFDDCITYVYTIDKDFTKNEDRKSDYSWRFTILLKGIND